MGSMSSNGGFEPNFKLSSGSSGKVVYKDATFNQQRY